MDTETQVSSRSVSMLDVSENQTTSLECERLWRQLQNVQEEVQSIPSKPIQPEGSADAQSCSQHVLREYEKRLKAEIVFLRTKQLDISLPQNKEIQYILLQQEQMKREQNLKEALSYIKAKHATLVKDIEQEEKLSEQLKQVDIALKAKEEAMMQNETSTDDHNSGQAVIGDMRLKARELKERNKYFQKKLNDIISKLPSPPAKEPGRRSTKTALDTTKDFDENSFLGLGAIIGRLMEQTLNHPEQPYVDIGEDMWPQHIEFLLRSQIIVKDADNSSRMKLLPYHL